jgi:hypothetical protein
VNTDFNGTPGEGELFDDPLFADTASYDFRLQAGSPAIDQGIELGYTEDIVGTSVPYGDAPDMGAFEYTEETSINFNFNIGTPGDIYIMQNSNYADLHFFTVRGRLVYKSKNISFLGNAVIHRQNGIPVSPLFLKTIGDKHNP